VDTAWTQKRFLPYGFCYTAKQPYGALLCLFELKLFG